MTETKRPAGRPVGTKIARRRYMTQEELGRFMDAAHKSGPKYALLFDLVYFFAMRVQEVVTMELTNFRLTVHQVAIKAAKGGEERVYDLPEQIEQRHDRWLKARAELPAAQENPYVFPSTTLPRSGHMSRDAAQAEFRLLCRKAEVPMPRSIHDLRHTSAQEMIRAGDDLATVQGWLRHRDIASTKAYISDEVSAEHQRARAACSARFL